jgi:hypothetical protein
MDFMLIKNGLNRSVKIFYDTGNYLNRKRSQANARNHLVSRPLKRPPLKRENFGRPRLIVNVSVDAYFC